jgi:hypothetical protein
MAKPGLQVLNEHLALESAREVDILLELKAV